MENDQGLQNFFKSPNTNPMLSPEQWACFFVDLTPEDFLSVINTCPEWNEMLHSKKTTTLLRLVLPLMIDYFPKATILVFRGVNKGAKTLMNETLESRTFLYPPKSSIHEDKGMGEYRYEESLKRRMFNDELAVINHSYDFISRGSSRLFLNCIDPGNQVGSETNPFLTRRISICLNGADDSDFRWLSFMLSKFGHHVWTLKCILMHHDGVRKPELKLAVLLRHFPSLKALEVIAPTPATPNENRFSETVLPDLPHLRSLCLSGWVRIFESFSKAVLRRYGAQLETLFLSESMLSWRAVTVGFLKQFLPNVRKLYLNKIRLSHLMKISQVGWNLETLTVRGDMYVSVDQLLDFVGGFDQSLTKLEMIISSHSNHDYADCCTAESLKVVSKLEVIRLNLELLNNMKWGWAFLEKMCQNVSVIHFDPTGRNVEGPNRDLFYEFGCKQINGTGKVSQSQLYGNP